ncbi:MAG TPA: hypothetical protein VGN70_11370 [Gammaproteobacteria bacterium]|jgi:hypothetical protein
MRKKQLSILLAVLGIAGLLGILGLRLWASSARLAMPQLSMVHAGADGRIYVVLADSLYVETADGTSVSITPLKALGLDSFWGDFAVLSDGSLILPSHVQPGDTAQKELDIYARKPVTAPQEDAEGVPLMHCILDTRQCTVLKGSGGKYFKGDRTFKLAVDEQAGHIFVADTAGQRLLMLDMQGGILAEDASDLKFPNQLTFTHQGTLLATDTNDFRLLEFAVTADGFGAKPEETSVTAWPDRHGRSFPAGVGESGDGTRWVVLADDGIAHGALYRLAPGATQVQPVTLPEGDVLDVAARADDVLVPDMARYRIYWFNRDGGALPDFGSPALQERLGALGRARAIYDAIFKHSLVAMLAMLLLLVLAQHVSKLVDAETEPEAAFAAVPQEFVAPAAGNIGLAWQGSDVVFRRRLSGALDKGSRRLVFGFALLGVLLVIAGIAVMDSSSLSRAVHNDNSQSRLEMDTFMIIILSAVAAVYLLFSIRFERLYVTGTGVRYQTWLVGPLRLFAPFYPSWSIGWKQLAAIRLAPRAGGSLAMQWFYELESHDGSIRRIGALFWRRVDKEDETGLTFRAAQKRDPKVLFQAIVRTALYKLMSDARKSVEARNGSSSKSPA